MHYGVNKFLFLSTFTLFLFLFSSACKDNSSKAELVEKEDNKQTKLTQNSTEESNMNILCFGNSLTAGYGLEEDQAWPSLLQSRLDSLGYNYNVINAGLSGETSSGGLNRLDWVLNQKTDFFILELGANDMLRGLDVESTRENLDSILINLKTKYPDVKIIIAGMMSPPNMGPTYEKSFNNIYPDLAEKHKASLIPFFLENVATIDSLNLADGKHPNAKGQELVLENVWNQLHTLLKK